MYKKSNSFVYKFVVNFPGFLKGALYKAENWLALSHE